MKRFLLAATAALLVAGCGGHSASSPPVVSRPAILTPNSSQQLQKLGVLCAPTVPAQMGECVQRKYGLPRLTLSPAAHGWDISVYQGEPAFPSSLRFVYNQVGDGAGYRDPNFSTNCARERERGIGCGAYLFVRPGNPYGQAYVIASVVSRTSLPPALDVEVPGAYGELCPIVHDLATYWHVSRVLAYTAPGLWPGGSTCGTKLWAAEWGTTGYAFSGWGSYVAQQTCGTCSIDEDVDHGLLVEKPTPPSHAQVLAREHRELDGHYQLRAELHSDIDRHHCRPGKPWYGHAKPRQYHTLCGRWLKHGGEEVRIVAAFHAKGVY